jgi:hypothetical protein
MTTHITKTWFDGDKVVTQEIPESEVYKQEPRCAVIVEVFGKGWRLDYMSLPVGKHRLYTQEYVYTTPPAAQPCPTCEALARTVMMDQTAHDTQRQPLTDEQIDAVCAPLGFAQMSPREVARAIEAAHGITGEKK